MQLYLLFSEFEFDFNVQIPRAVGNGVWLDRIDDVDAAIHHGDYRNVVPPLVVPYQVAGVGQVHVCLRTEVVAERGLDAGLGRIWWALISMRLAKPFRFAASGFVLVNGAMIPRFGPYSYASVVNPAHVGRLDEASLGTALRIHSAMRSWRGRGMERPRSALILFSQSTMGMVLSWQLSMLGLIAALEAVFPHPRARSIQNAIDGGASYGERLARRVASFLGPRPNLLGTRVWLARIYDAHRNSLAHGIHVAPARRSQLRANSDQLVRMHESVRLVLLGMLGTPANIHRARLPINANVLGVQQAIEATGPAPQDFLENQVAYRARRRSGLQ